MSSSGRGVLTRQPSRMKPYHAAKSSASIASPSAGKRTGESVCRTGCSVCCLSSMCADPLTCRSFVSRISEYLRGELDRRQLWLDSRASPPHPHTEPPRTARRTPSPTQGRRDSTVLNPAPRPSVGGGASWHSQLHRDRQSRRGEGRLPGLLLWYSLMLSPHPRQQPAPA